MAHLGSELVGKPFGFSADQCMTAVGQDLHGLCRERIETEATQSPALCLTSLFKTRGDFNVWFNLLLSRGGNDHELTLCSVLWKLLKQSIS